MIDPKPKRTKRVKPDPELVKLADSLLLNYKKPEDLIGENGLLKQLTKILVERALEVEMTEHLGYDKSTAITNTAANARNGHRGKTLKGDFGDLPLDIPHDRQASFEPQRVAKHRPVRPRLERARDLGAPGRNVRYRGLSQLDFGHYRRGE